jgi:hypothetical protein
MPTYAVRDRVAINMEQSNLNFYFLNENGGIGAPLTIVDFRPDDTTSGDEYLLELPSGYRVWVREREIKPYDGPTLLDYVKSKIKPGSNENLIEVGPFGVIRQFPDGSAIIYKNLPSGRAEMALEANDIAAIKNQCHY